MNIRHSKETINAADDIVVACSHYDSFTRQYEICFDSIGKEDLGKVAASIMRDDPDYACESLGADNPLFEETMSTICQAMCGNISSKDLQEALVMHVVSYQKRRIKALIEDRLFIYNQRIAA